MTALTLRASQALFNTPYVALSRLLSGLVTVAEVFAEARQQAAEAHRKYPFTDW